MCKDIYRQSPYEGPHQTGFDTDRDRDDHAQHEHRMWLCISDSEVWGYRQFDKGRHHRADRSKEQGHRTGRYLGEMARRLRPPARYHYERPNRRRRLSEYPMDAESGQRCHGPGAHWDTVLPRSCFT